MKKPSVTIRMLLSCLFAVTTAFASATSPVDAFSASGRLKDVFRDPTDPRYLFSYLQSSNRAYYITIQCAFTNSAALIESAIGARLDITGDLVPSDESITRLYIADELRFWPRQEHHRIEVREPPPKDLFAAPNEERLWHVTPDCISTQSFHCIRGKVLAVWNGDSILIRTANGRTVNAELRDQAAPAVGETVDVVGLPETTLYNLRLNRARWRPAPPLVSADEDPLPTSAREIVTGEDGQSAMNMRLHGRPLRLTGIIRNLPGAEPGNDLMYLEDNGYLAPIRIAQSVCRTKDLEIGCTVEIAGVCVMDVDIWRPNAVFPRIRGYKLVVNRAEDVRVLARPSWWTPAKLCAVIGALLVALIAIFIRNRILKRISDLRVRDRTRLSVELHDALSQALTCVALEMQTTSVLARENLPAALEHLDIAGKSLLSCRQELRNCLQDLRSTALDNPNLADAIRNTLEPHVTDVKTVLRFNIPRARLSDNEAHAVLSIIRELALNAVRHGKATVLRIAGVIDGNRLLFSVRDNGGGFDPENRPGIRQGHFGLQGILERVRSLDGSLAIVSRVGKGTRVKGVIAITDPSNGRKPS